MLDMNEADAALQKVMQANGKYILAKLDKRPAEMALAQQDLALACRAYNQLIGKGDDDEIAAHRAHAMSKELERQIA